MSDMLIKLYDCPLESRLDLLAKGGIIIKRALAIDKQLICDFVYENFAGVSLGWVGECELALMQQPSTCYIAVSNNKVVGFCCFDSTAKGMFGPLGVSVSYRRKGIAQELMSCSFEAMRAAGYAYAVIGWVSSEEFYQKHCGAIVIPDSAHGIYDRMISR